MRRMVARQTQCCLTLSNASTEVFFLDQSSRQIDMPHWEGRVHLESLPILLYGLVIIPAKIEDPSVNDANGYGNRIQLFGESHLSQRLILASGCCQFFGIPLMRSRIARI